MKKVAFTSITVFVLLVALTVLGSSLLNSKIDQNLNNLDSEVLGEVVENENTFDINFNEKNYRVSWFKTDLENISLIANFDQRDQANQISQQNNCIEAINAGFYGLNSEPLGLFISDGEELFKFRSNKIMNAILSVNYMDTPRITRSVPEDPLYIAVQTGPILIENDQVLKVSISNDKNARRSVAAVTGNNELYFLSIYSKNSSFMGPFMKDLPDILSLIEDKLEVNIADAINLDGGSASYFKSGNLVLSEISPIGALFCVQ